MEKRKENDRAPQKFAVKIVDFRTQAIPDRLFFEDFERRLDQFLGRNPSFLKKVQPLSPPRAPFKPTIWRFKQGF